MSFLGYPEYKNSHTDFLGNVPAHWNVERLKHCAEVFPSNVDKKSVDGQIPVRLCNYTDVYYNEVIQHDSAFMQATATKEQVKRFELQKGDVVFTKDSESVDDIAIAAYVPKNMPDVIYGYHLSIARPKASVVGKFLKRFFDSQEAKSYFAVSANGLTRVGLGQHAVDNTPIALPSLEEQRTIATFLDHETARIDALVEEQQRLIALLKEKRQSVISHAVTKGLVPDVPMKDSGVEWLGEVPEHWDVTRGKMVSDIFIPQRNKPELNESADGYFWVTMEDMRSGEISKAKRCVSIAEITKTGSRVLEKGAVVASCVGNFGIASLLLVDAVINQQLQAYIPRGLSAAYLRDVITCSKPYFDLVGTAATLVYVNQEGFANLPVPLPPIDEQKEIEAYISKSNADFDVAISDALKLIALLQERRSALISAAVTGKIDVRGWKSPTDSVVSTEAKQMEVV